MTHEKMGQDRPQGKWVATRPHRNWDTTWPKQNL
jgi:hypothetical protein